MDHEARARERGEVDLEGEARALRERLRAGELSQERLELAACCRHEAALWALGRELPEPRWASRRANREEWVKEELARFGSKVVARAALLALSLSLSRAEVAGFARNVPEVLAWGEAVLAEAPDVAPRAQTEADQSRARELLSGVWQPAFETEESAPPERRAFAAAIRAVQGAVAFGSAGSPWGRKLVRTKLIHCLEALQASWGAPDSDALPPGVPCVFAAAQAALAAWALGSEGSPGP